MLPPRWVRRLVLTPVAWVLICVLVALMPAVLTVAALLVPFGSGRRRVLRVLWMAAVYLAMEAVGLIVLLGLWIGAGFGWKIRGPYFQRVHYALTGRYLRVLYHQARFALGVRVAVVGTDPDVAAPGSRPWCSAGTPARVTRSC